MTHAMAITVLRQSVIKLGLLLRRPASESEIDAALETVAELPDVIDAIDRCEEQVPSFGGHRNTVRCVHGARGSLTITVGPRDDASPSESKMRTYHRRTCARHGEMWAARWDSGRYVHYLKHLTDPGATTHTITWSPDHA